MAQCCFAAGRPRRNGTISVSTRLALYKKAPSGSATGILFGFFFHIIALIRLNFSGFAAKNIYFTCLKVRTRLYYIHMHA
jgi:hypothetical protein